MIINNKNIDATAIIDESAYIHPRAIIGKMSRLVIWQPLDQIPLSPRIWIHGILILDHRQGKKHERRIYWNMKKGDEEIFWGEN